MPFVWFIRAWRIVVSPLYGQVCRYYPSCSMYGLEAFEIHGVLKGMVLTGWRILRCNPLTHGGVDHVPGSAREARPKSIHRGDGRNCRTSSAQSQSECVSPGCLCALALLCEDL